MNNPYIDRSGLNQPTMFHGRAYELHEIATFVSHNQSVSIVGQRRIGKTSLMQHLIRDETRSMLKLAPENLLVYQDCAFLPRGGEMEVVSNLSTAIASVLRTAGFDPEPALTQAVISPTNYIFHQAMRNLKQRGLRVVLMLDEFEELAANPKLDRSFLIGWRALGNNHDMVFITASARHLIDFTDSSVAEGARSSPFFNIFRPITLGLLDEADARALIRTPMQASGVNVSPHLEEFIYELVGGHPLGLQIACYHAWSNPDDLQKIERLTMDELDQHFDYYWKHLGAAEKDALRDPVTASVRAAEDPSVREALRNLIRKCLLVQVGKSYKYPSKVLAEFVSARFHETLANSSVEQHNQSQPTSPSEIESPIKRVLGQSLPEMIGGLGVTLVTGFVWLIYTMLNECYPKPDPEKCRGIVRLAYDLFDKPVTVWTTLGALIVTFTAISVISGMKRRGLIRKSKK